MRLTAALAVLLLSACTYTCDAQNCADGCCAQDGVCLVGHTDRYCGLGGVACQDCSADDKVCSERVKPGAAATWSCDYPCSERLGKTCTSATACCASQICYRGSCEVCRAYDAECDGTDQCCNARKCQYINFLWRCR